MELRLPVYQLVLIKLFGNSQNKVKVEHLNAHSNTS